MIMTRHRPFDDMRPGWQCPYCGGKNSDSDRSCPGCGCMQLDTLAGDQEREYHETCMAQWGPQPFPPEPKKRGVEAYRRWQENRPAPYGVIRCVPPQPTPDTTDIVKGADPTPIIGAIFFGLIVVYILVAYFAVGF